MSGEAELYPCAGVCIPDADETHCLGCGRPWGQPVTDTTPPPATPPSATLPSPDESPTA